VEAVAQGEAGRHVRVCVARASCGSALDGELVGTCGPVDVSRPLSECDARLRLCAARSRSRSHARALWPIDRACARGAQARRPTRELPVAPSLALSPFHPGSHARGKMADPREFPTRPDKATPL
jgi:hypothetical protein